MKRREIIRDDIKTSNYLGPVVDINDPRKEGRIKVRVFGKFDELEVEDIPWCEPSFIHTGGSSSGGGNFSLPKIGTLVQVTFDNGNIYQPMWTYQTKLSEELKEALSSDDDYQNSHSLIYDTQTEPGPLKIWYTPTNGVKIEMATSVINIKNDLSIIMNSDEGKTVHIQKGSISIGKENESDEPAVLGLKNEDVLNRILDKIDKILTIIIKFATTESTAASGAYIFAPLVPALTTLLQDVTSEKATLNKIKVKVPETKSKTVSIDK